VAFGRGLFDGHVMCEGCLWVSAARLFGPGDVFSVGGGLGLGDVEDGGVKAVSVDFDSDVQGLDMHTWVEGSEVGYRELPQAGSGIESSGEAAVNSSIPWLVQL